VYVIYIYIETCKNIQNRNKLIIVNGLIYVIYRNWQTTLSHLIDEHIKKDKFFIKENKFEKQLINESPYGFYSLHPCNKIKILKVNTILWKKKKKINNNNNKKI